MNELNIGDTIKCSNGDELIDIDYELNVLGYHTEFLYEKDGKSGLWIIITGIGD